MIVNDAGGFLLRAMVHSDLDQVLTWRNHAEIRRYMFTQHEITLTEHTSWFEKASNEPFKKLLIFEQNETALGFVQFSIQCDERVADWGFYVAPNAPKSTGRKLGQVALAYAFEQLEVHKVRGQALDFNERSIKFHQRLGFQQEEAVRDQHFDGESYHAVICFRLLRNEWALSIPG